MKVAVRNYHVISTVPTKLFRLLETLLLPATVSVPFALLKDSRPENS